MISGSLVGKSDGVALTPYLFISNIFLTNFDLPLLLAIRITLIKLFGSCFSLKDFVMLKNVSIFVFSSTIDRRRIAFHSTLSAMPNIAW